jgi:surfactin synthase thioesterase subunit
MAQPALASVRLVAVTLPGHAGTPPPDDFSIEDLARLAAELAADVSGDVVVGFSMGASVGLEMAASGAFSGPVAGSKRSSMVPFGIANSAQPSCSI